MKIIEIILISLSLATDAFAVSICKGIVIKKNKLKKSIIISSYFGIFQLLMTLIGYLFGSLFSSYIISMSYIIAFILLLIIGIDMIVESLNNKEYKDEIRFSEMFFLSLATSIDALVIGLTFSLFDTNIILNILVIGIITFILSFIGVMFGIKIKKIVKFNSSLLGGIVLIIIGIKILLKH